MSNIYLLVASILTLGQVPGWQSSLFPPVPTPLPVSVQPPVQPPVQPQVISATAFLLPDLIELATPRPASGSQLYQQRLAALRAGKVYTRIPAQSFYQNWINATQQPTYDQWVRLLHREAQAIAQGQGTNRLTILVGDSLFLWFPPDHLSGDQLWLNQGISGDTTTGVLQRLSAFSSTRPNVIHVMVGINDLRRGVPEASVLANSRRIMQQLRRNHPNAQIFIHSILPTRWKRIPLQRIHAINRQLGVITHQEGVYFLDLQQYFADGDGNLRQELTTDGLHLNALGYATWQWVLQVFKSS